MKFSGDLKQQCVNVGGVDHSTIYQSEALQASFGSWCKLECFYFPVGVEHVIVLTEVHTEEL